MIEESQDVSPHLVSMAVLIGNYQNVLKHQLIRTFVRSVEVKAKDLH